MKISQISEISVKPYFWRMMRKWLPQKISNVSLPELFAGAKKGVNKLLPAPSATIDLPQLPIPRTPFDRYRLRKLLRKLNLRSVYGRSVLEVGCGVGDLLLEIAKYQPKEIYGVER
ncbi:MAG: class I SAM-dependent methyltransferase, partial [Bacteroidota bacterium]